MRIGFVGAGGTGKTSVINHLNVMKLGLKYLPSVIRKTFAEKGATEASHAAMSPGERWQIQKACFEARLQLDKDHLGTDTISDRTILDHAAYCFYWCSQVITEEELDWLEKQAILNLRTYDLIFYFPIVDFFKPEDDQFRYQGEAYRKMTEALMIGLGNLWHVPVLQMPDNTIPVRANIVAEKIKSYRRGALRR